MGRSAVRVLAIAAGTSVGLLPTAAFGAPDDPSGNNGTIKIDGVAFDDHPDNEPHPGCAFQLDFYGFDEGDLWADVTFTAHAPTAGGTLLTDRVFIGEDPNDGGGSTGGLDASRTFDLSAALAGIEPRPQQGWHVKLTVHADGSPRSRHQAQGLLGRRVPGRRRRDDDEHEHHEHEQHDELDHDLDHDGTDHDGTDHDVHVHR